MRLSVALAVSCLLATSLSAADRATAAIKKQTNIPAQDLESALEMLARQQDFQILYRSEIVARQRTQGAVGELTAEESLTRLLNGTGLTYRYLDEGAVTILPVSGSDRAGGATAAPHGVQSSSRRTRLHLAQTDASSPSRAEGQKEVVRQGDGTIDDPAGLRKWGPIEEIVVKGIPEILVRGKRTLNADIQRTEDDMQPYVVFDRAQIERSNATSVEELLKSRLPMNALHGSKSQVGDLSSSRSSIDLRGLGTNQTLILVDGRRLPGVSMAGTGNAGFDQPDINGIPVSIIERIEVLPSTASGIYGGGATGGVINIITRKDYDGVDVRATYGNAFDSDVTERRISAVGGFSFEEGRTRLVVSASFADMNPLLVGDRDFVRQGRARMLANNPAAFFDATTPPLGYTSNIRNANGENLQLKPEFGGALLDSPITYVPVGYAGPASDNGAALAGNAGQYNLELPEDINGARQMLVNNPETRSASLNLTREFNSVFSAFADLSWFRNEGETLWAGTPGAVTLAPSAPNNPFTTAITVRFPATGLSFPVESLSDTRRVVGGLVARLPHDWTAAADYAWSRSRVSTTRTNTALGDPDGDGPGVPVSTAFGNGSLDILSDINAFPLDYAPYLLPSPNLFFGPADTILRDANLRFSGPLLEAPGGPVTLSALIERREEKALDIIQDAMLPNGARSVALFPTRAQTVQSYYAEARVPLISDTNALAWARAFEVQASVRHDRYETDATSPAVVGGLPSRDAPLPELSTTTNEVDATKYTLGLRFAPTPDLMVRASFGTGFLPPSIAQIVPNATLFTPRTLIDPKRGNIASTVPAFTQIPGGNPDLVPEESASWSAGLVFTPRWLPDLRLSLDYTRIEKEDEIRSFNAQRLLEVEDYLPGRVVRAPLTDEDRALGYTGGVILEIDHRLVNIAESRLEAYDLQADYTWRTDRTGEFHFYAVASHQPYLESQVAPNAPVIDSAGFDNGPLEWRANAGLTWTRGPLSLGWNVQHFDDYYVYASGLTDPSIEAAIASQGSATVSAQTYHDVFASFRFDDTASGGLWGLLDDTTVLIGVQNVLDREPPILATTGATGAYSTYGDPRLRRFTLTLHKTFE